MTTRTNFPRKIVEWPDKGIIMADGTRLSARIWLPEGAEKYPVPAILEHLPYRKRDGTIARDELTHPYLAGHGYACIRVDMRGSGDSDGIMADEYTQQEWDDAIAVMEWVRSQPWSTGDWGMMGISWGGFNSLQVAALRPEGLKAIITLCSTVDRYADDIHYKGGCMLGENLGWAAQMLAYSSRPPDPEVVGDRWREMWMERLKSQPFLLETWLAHQQRDAYWEHGSVCEDYDAIDAAVLALGGWHDGYRNTPEHLARNLNCPIKTMIGPWIHKYPHYAAPEPRIGFLQEALRWWDHWLK
ncbi:MAG: CocE/NonD family hydrolase, partial [Boseongicola sp.]